MWRVLDVGEAPMVGDEWWYQTGEVSGGYWTPCIGPFVHIEVGAVVIRRKISDTKELGTSPNKPSAEISALISELYSNKPADRVYSREEVISYLKHAETSHVG